MPDRDLAGLYGLETRVFYNGQIFDAYVFATDLIKSAKKSITLIDNYIDESVLMMLAKRGKNVKASILTGSVSKILQLDIDKHNSQYPPITVEAIKNNHDPHWVMSPTENPSETALAQGCILKFRSPYYQLVVTILIWD